MNIHTIITLFLFAMASLGAVASPQVCSNDPELALLPHNTEALIDGCNIASLTTSSGESTSNADLYNDDDDEYDDEIEYISAKEKKKKKKKKKKTFNSPKTNSFWGFSAGYTSKQWRKKTSTGEEQPVYFLDGKTLHGVQLGVRYNPLFNYGFGVDISLFYEYYHYRYTTPDTNNKDLLIYSTLNEHVVRMPIHLEYRFNFSRSFQLFIFGGIAIDYIIDGNMVISNQNTPNSDANEIITDIYGSYIPTESRFNAAYTLGGGIRFGAIQFNVSNVRGIFNGTPYQEYILLQDNPLNITMSVMF